MAIKYSEEKVQPAKGMANKNTDLVDKIKRWKNDSEGWISTWEAKQDRYHRMRMRIKKAKTFPFQGCSNIRMPTIETKLRKLKAALVNVIFGIRPIVQVIPSPSGNWESARKIEKFLDHLIMDKMDMKSKAVIAIDQCLEKGFYIIKPYWRIEIINRVENFSLEDISMEEAQWLFDVNRRSEEVVQALAQRSQADMSSLVLENNQKQLEKATEDILAGKENIKLTLQDVIYNCPDISLCSPDRIYVPTTTGFDPQSAEYIIHEFFLPMNQVKQNAKHKGWNIDSIDEIESKKKINLTDKKTDVTKDEREGISRLQSAGELVRIWECYCYDDINNDNEDEKCVVTIAPDFDQELRKISLPFFSGKNPFVKLFYELIDDRWFSHRGIPELIEDIVKEIDMIHMQKLDYGTITNAPMFLYRAGQVNTKTTQFVFGQGLPVNGMQPLDDIMRPMQSHNPNVEFSYEREQMILETKVEELMGQVDFSLQSMINKRQPRTLGEVQMQQQNMQQVFSLDADMFTRCFTQLFNWIYDLWSQYGDDEYEFAYFGKQGYEKIKLTKEEIQNKYQITVRGNDQNTNPQVRQQKAQMIMMGLQNPIAMQSGVITPVHVAQAYKRFYQMMDIPNWEELVSTPEQITQQMQQQQQNQPPPPDDVKLKGEDLTDGEKAQVLQKRGIQPDVEGRKLNEGNRRQEAGIEQLSKIGGMIGKGGQGGE